MFYLPFSWAITEPRKLSLLRNRLPLGGKLRDTRSSVAAREGESHPLRSISEILMRFPEWGHSLSHVLLTRWWHCE